MDNNEETGPFTKFIQQQVVDRYFKWKLSQTKMKKLGEIANIVGPSGVLQVMLVLYFFNKEVKSRVPKKQLEAQRFTGVQNIAGVGPGTFKKAIDHLKKYGMIEEIRKPSKVGRKYKEAIYYRLSEKGYNFAESILYRGALDATSYMPIKKKR